MNYTDLLHSWTHCTCRCSLRGINHTHPHTSAQRQAAQQDYPGVLVGALSEGMVDHSPDSFPLSCQTKEFFAWGPHFLHINYNEHTDLSSCIFNTKTPACNYQCVILWILLCCQGQCCSRTAVGSIIIFTSIMWTWQVPSAPCKTNWRMRIKCWIFYRERALSHLLMQCHISGDVTWGRAWIIEKSGTVGGGEQVFYTDRHGENETVMLKGSEKGSFNPLRLF